jgi:hypothetical protein
MQGFLVVEDEAFGQSPILLALAALRVDVHTRLPADIPARSCMTRGLYGYARLL